MKQKLMYLGLIVSIMMISIVLLLTLSAAPVSSHGVIDSNSNQTGVSYLQATVTPTAVASEAIVTSTLTAEPITDSGASTFDITFGELGYGEAVLSSPVGRAEYTVRLPSNWELTEGGFIRFNLSYHFRPVDASAELPATFGDVRVKVDGQTVEVFTIEDQDLDNVRLRVPLSLSSPRENGQTQHKIEVTLNARYLCIIPHRAALTIHPTSSISFEYTQPPLIPDLSVYPLPFYQRSVEPDEVIFGLPSEPSLAEATGAVSVASKLGSLTDNRMVISAMLDSRLMSLITSRTAALDQHLVVIGQPQNNQILPLLGELTELPVSLHQRQMSLSTQGPTTVSPGQEIVYTFIVTNTADRSANVSLVDVLPAFSELVVCEPQCTDDAAAREIAWADNSIEPAETKTFSLTLQATDVITEAYLENTITLVEDGVGPLNADTFVSDLSLGDNDQEVHTSTVDDEGYLFAVDGRAVAANDGIVQEIVSPWNENRAVLIITGLNEDAVGKASRAMSSSARFPGMKGAFALVQEVYPPEDEAVTSPALVRSFADMGYDDTLIQGTMAQQADYHFIIPFGWQLTENALVDFRFTHSQAIPNGSSGFTIFFNDRPIATLALSEETAPDGSIQAKLPSSVAKPGERNQLTVEVIPFEGDGCAEGDGFEEFWFVASRESSIVLDHDEVGGTRLDLDFYPIPFSSSQSLVDLLFALPGTPTAGEWDNTLRLAAAIGSSAGGRTILPVVALGKSLSEEELANYNIIAIGRPTRNPLIQQVSSELPQPFVPDSDEIQQSIDDVILRLPPSTDLGYVQLIPSPWNSERALLAVTGTTDEGADWAARATFDRSLFRRLKGDLALIQNETVDTVDTRSLREQGVALALAASVPELTATTTTTSIGTTAVGLEPTPQPGAEIETPRSMSTPVAETPGLPVWLVPMVAITGVVILLIFVIAFVQARARQRG